MRFLKYLVIIVALIIYLRKDQIRIEVDYIGIEQKMIKESTNLLKDGKLSESGWGRQPIKIMNEESLNYLQKTFRYKKWDYYQFSTDQIYFGIALVDLGYIQSIQILFYDIEKDKFHNEDVLLLPYLHSKLELPLKLKDNLQYSIDGALSVQIQFNQHQKHIIIKSNKINADFIIQGDDSDSIVTVTPINQDGSKFFYNQKTYNWLINGYIQLEQKYQLSDINANAGADWGRGVWDYNTPWLWMSAQGFMENKKRIAINLGGAFQHKSAQATEESIFIDKQLYKLKDLVYDYDVNDYSKNITVISKGKTQQDFYDLNVNEGDFCLVFTPAIVNHNKKELVLIKLDMHQLIGYYSGGYVVQNKLIIFNNIVGITEFNKSQW